MNPNPTPKGDSLASVIVRVTDEVRARQKRGERPDPEEYVAQYPQFADDIREVLAAVRVMDPPAPAPAPPPDLPPELADHPRYRILRELGRGGMGVVYLARHTVMDRDVVIKVISRSLLDQPGAVERFRREVQAAAKLSHPNIVTAHDAEQAGDLHMLVMEYVEGLSLAHVLQRRGPLPVAFACHYARQGALGLQHAHERGMVHRDIKPANLMLTPKGRVKILDFGLAKVASERGRGKGLTGSGAYMGTPEYTAPEQATDARSADIRADLYSLGCTLYCLLTGHPPFEEDTAVKAILAHLERAPQPLPELRPDVSRELWAVVARLLAKEPARRYQTPAEAAQALTPFCKAGPKDVPAPAAPPPAVASPARATAAPQDTKGPGGRSKAQASRVPARAQTAPAEPEEEKPEAERKRRRRRKAAPAADGKRWWLVGAGVAGVVVLLAGAIFWVAHLTGQRHPDNLAQAPPDKPPAQPSPPSEPAPVAPAAAQPAAGQQPAPGPAEVPGKAAEAKPPEPAETPKPRAPAPAAPMPEPKPAKALGEMKQLIGHVGAITALAASADGHRLLSGDQYGGVRLWDVDKGESTPLLPEPERLGNDARALVKCVAFSRDGRLAAAGTPLWYAAWNADTGKGLSTFGGDICNLVFSSDGRLIVSASSPGGRSTLGVWAIPDRPTLGPGPTFHWSWPSAQAPAAFSCMVSVPGEQLLLCSDGSWVHIIDVKGFKYVPTADFKGDAGTANLRFKEVGTPVRSISPVVISALACAPKEQKEPKFAGVADRVVQIWDLKTGRSIHSLNHPGRVTALAYSPDGRSLLTACEDAMVRLWDVTTAKELRFFQGDTSRVLAVTFSGDGRLAFTAGNDTVIRVWDLSKPAPEP